MAISLIKEFKQKQKISLTPLLKKSIDLLQLSRYELIQKIDQEIEINPFVEKEITDDFEFDENYNDADFDFNVAAVENLRESLIYQVNDLSLDLENNLVIGTEYGAAKLTNNQTWEVFFDEGEGMGLSSNIIKYIDTDLNNNIWACSPDGISIIHTDYTYSYLNMNNTDLPSNFFR